MMKLFITLVFKESVDDDDNAFKKCYLNLMCLFCFYFLLTYFNYIIVDYSVGVGEILSGPTTCCNMEL